MEFHSSNFGSRSIIASKKTLSFVGLNMIIGKSWKPRLFPIRNMIIEYFLRLHAKRTWFLLILFFYKARLGTLAFLIMYLFHQFALFLALKFIFLVMVEKIRLKLLKFGEELPVGLHLTLETQFNHSNLTLIHMLMEIVICFTSCLVHLHWCNFVFHFDVSGLLWIG